MPPKLKVPFALTESGDVVSPAEAVRGETYRCPGCGSRIGYRGTEKPRPHFYHRGAACSQETILHVIAKKLIVRAVQRWKDGVSGRPTVRLPCKNPYCENTRDFPLPDSIEAAAEEVRVDNRWTVDVALLRDGAPVAAVEVVVTHEAEPEKRDGISIRFIEVAARDILEDPLVWHRITDHGREVECEEHEERSRERAERERKRREVEEGVWREIEKESWYRPPMRKLYQVRPYRCFKCGTLTPIWSWRGENPPRPRPPTVRRERIPRVWGSRWTWVSCCPACDQYQHPHHVEQALAAW